jgi:hypothetical protein
MRRKSKFTHRAASDIRAWVHQGLTNAQIADKLECTVGTLKVKCSHLGISLRRKNTNPEHVQPCSTSRMALAPPPSRLIGLGRKAVLVTLSPWTMKQLSSRAQPRHLDGAALAAKLLERIVADDLFEAVLDDAESDQPSKPSTDI